MIGVNTYGISKLLKKDFDGTLKALAGAGVTSIEPCVIFPRAYGRIKRKLFKFGFSVVGLDGGNWFGIDAYDNVERVKELGLTVKSAHLALANDSADTLSRATPYALEFALVTGLKYFVVSLMADSPKVCEKFVPALKDFTEALGKIGVGVLYHNHDGEVKAVNGVSALDYLFDKLPELGLELDVGWALYGGANPLDLMTKYADRIKILHFKDIKEGVTSRKHLFSAVGEGALPLKDIIRAFKALNLGEYGYVIDQDASDGDLLRDVIIGVENVRRLL